MLLGQGRLHLFPWRCLFWRLTQRAEGVCVRWWWWWVACGCAQSTLPPVYRTLAGDLRRRPALKARRTSCTCSLARRSTPPCCTVPWHTASLQFRAAPPRCPPRPNPHHQYPVPASTRPPHPTPTTLTPDPRPHPGPHPPLPAEPRGVGGWRAGLRQDVAAGARHAAQRHRAAGGGGIQPGGRGGVRVRVCACVHCMRACERRCRCGCALVMSPPMCWGLMVGGGVGVWGLKGERC